jgi:hypothetical protein
VDEGGLNEIGEEVQDKKPELKDYSGKFMPGVAYTDSSKEMLAKFLKVYAKLYVLKDGLWHIKARQELGEEKAMAWYAEILERIIPDTHQ